MKAVPRIAIALCAAYVMFARAAVACSVCFGDPASAQAQGLNAAVWTLLGTTVAVLGGAVAFFGTIVYRTRQAAREGANHA